MLQGRTFSYVDTQRYRLGANFNDLPTNKPLAAVANNKRDGAMQTQIFNADDFTQVDEGLAANVAKGLGL